MYAERWFLSSFSYTKPNPRHHWLDKNKQEVLLWLLVNSVNIFNKPSGCAGYLKSSKDAFLYVFAYGGPFWQAVYVIVGVKCPLIGVSIAVCVSGRLSCGCVSQMSFRASTSLIFCVDCTALVGICEVVFVRCLVPARMSEDPMVGKARKLMIRLGLV